MPPTGIVSGWHWQLLNKAQRNYYLVRFYSGKVSSSYSSLKIISAENMLNCYRYNNAKVSWTSGEITITHI